MHKKVLLYNCALHKKALLCNCAYTKKEEIMKQQTYCDICSLETKNKILIDEINKTNAEYTQRQEFISKNNYMN